VVEGYAGYVQALRAEIERLLAAALQSDLNHAAAIKHLQEVQVDEVANLKRALDSRDLIGQAKGVLMVTFGCSADEAFALMATQSQHENRKVVAVAVDIVARTQRLSRDGGEGPVAS
jgi:AmiR/NasT family two-component response regulator